MKKNERKRKKKKTQIDASTISFQLSLKTKVERVVYLEKNKAEVEADGVLHSPRAMILK